MWATWSPGVARAENSSIAMEPSTIHFALMGTGMGMMNIFSSGNIMPKANNRE